jgi:hypothetical protein
MSTAEPAAGVLPQSPQQQPQPLPLLPLLACEAC